MFDAHADELRRRAADRVVAALFHTGEGEIVELLSEATARWPQVRVGSYPRFGPEGADVEIVLKSTDSEALAEAVAWLEPGGSSGPRGALAAAEDPRRARRLGRANVEASVRRRARELPRRPQRGPARGGDDDRGAAARDRRRRLGQDAGAHLPRRLPARRARRRAERDPRDHLHQQGGRRDAQADRGDGRPAGAGDLDPDLPRRLRAHPAPRGRAARLPLELHDLRPGRPGPARAPVPGGARARPQALHRRAAIHAPDLEREEPADRARRVRRSGSRASTTRRSPTSTRSTSGGSSA